MIHLKIIFKVNREYGTTRRPPYSYMHLIQMAITSRPDRRMMLKDIYSWIESSFSFYKYSSNKGWRVGCLTAERTYSLKHTISTEIPNLTFLRTPFDTTCRCTIFLCAKRVLPTRNQHSPGGRSDLITRREDRASNP